MKKEKKNERLEIDGKVIIKNKTSFGVRIWKNKYMYLLFLPMLIYMLIFCYYPMYGVILAFKDFNFGLGILHSPWADHFGWGNFIDIFDNPQFFIAFRNTLIISLGRLVFEFPIPIILALLLNEIRSTKYKRTVQTIFTFPHFISWIIVYGLFFNLFSSDGVVNQLLALVGIGKQTILSSPNMFRPLLFISDNWKEMGWSAIIYLASISGISPELYEAAKIDGASRRKLVWHITLPCILGTIAILLVLQVAGTMNAGFDQIFNMYNPAVQDKSDIIDTLIYRLSFKQGSDFGFTTAIGLFKSVINFILLIIANTFVKRSTGKGIY